ncbi:hypothetical protein MMC19_002508 [Ptychographa xylographoides]|nr:hypothetical protein [Ptychographa xylographoides]
MHAPLYDHFGKLRYFMGAQIDVSNVIDESPELETLQRVIIQQDSRHHVEPEKNEFQQFVETLDMDELKAVRTWEDRMLHEMPEDEAPSRKTKSRRPGLARNHHSEILKNGSALDNAPGASIGMYQNYMLVRPYPSLKILFTSPSLSVPGVVQTPIMDRLGGSARVRYELGQALEEGREVTAKVRWKANEVEEGVDRWIFFTPLVGRKGEIGVWMAILEDDIPETMERTQQARTVKPNYGTTSPIPEEPEQEEPATRDVVLLHHTQPRGYRHSLDRNLSMTSQENHSPPLERVQRSREPSISGKTINSILSDNDNEYSSLEDRLRRKRERDMGMMLDQPGMALRKTYKSFAPDSFINY